MLAPRPAAFAIAAFALAKLATLSFNHDHLVSWAMGGERGRRERERKQRRDYSLPLQQESDKVQI